MTGGKPRIYTPEEVREQFLRYIWHLITYWENEEGHDKRQALEGLAFSILVTLDGESAELPGFHVIPLGTYEDQEYFRKLGRNWYPLCRIDHDYDIGGTLHDHLFAFDPVKESDGDIKNIDSQ